jgi:Ferritin-like domain
VTASITRGELLGRGARGGAALLAGGASFAGLAGTARAAPLPLQDLAYARLLVGAELLASDFYSQAIGADVASGETAAYLKRAYFNEREHYASVGGILTGAGLTPAVPGDFDFSYPAGTFQSEAAVAAFGAMLETAVLGTYLGAIAGLQTDAFKTGLASIAACEAQHGSYLATLAGRKAFELSFPPPLTMQQASDAFDAYTS